MASDFEPTLVTQPLSAAVERNRVAPTARYERLSEVLAPRMDAHVGAYETALATLADAHQQIADTTNLDLTGDTRPTAVWQMSGRCIGLARAVLTLLRLGYCGEAVVLGRSLHEADRLLDAFADTEEDELLRTWLADEGNDWVRPRKAREARSEPRTASTPSPQRSEFNPLRRPPTSAAASTTPTHRLLITVELGWQMP